MFDEVGGEVAVFVGDVLCFAGLGFVVVEFDMTDFAFPGVANESVAIGADGLVAAAVGDGGMTGSGWVLQEWEQAGAVNAVRLGKAGEIAEGRVEARPFAASLSILGEWM